MKNPEVRPEIIRLKGVKLGEFPSIFTICPSDDKYYSGKYKCKVIVQKDNEAAMAELKRGIDLLRVSKFPSLNPDSVTINTKDGDEPKSNPKDNPNFFNSIFFMAKSEKEPALYLSDKSQPSEGQILPGNKINAFVTAYATTTNGPQISFNLVGIQKVGEGVMLPVNQKPNTELLEDIIVEEKPIVDEIMDMDI